MSNPFSWYARYPRDYGEKTAHLSLAEHGAYSLLLDHYMSSGKPIAIAIDLLSVCYRVCRAQTDDERAAVESVVKQYFTVEDDGCLHNKRADEELGKRKNLSETRTFVGKAGAAKRWSSKKEVAIAMPNAMPIAMANGIANPMANDMANGCTSTATATNTNEEDKPPFNSPLRGEGKKRSIRDRSVNQRNAPEVVVSAPNLNQEVWQRWVDYRKSIGKPLKPVSLNAAAADLAKYGANQAAVVEQSIAQGWQGLFPIKQAGKPVKDTRFSAARADFSGVDYHKGVNPDGTF